MEVIDTVLERWKARGVRVNNGASKRDLARLADELGPMPADIRYYFSRVNGMQGGDPEPDTMVSFWSIDRLLSDPWRRSGADSGGPFNDLGFADVLLDSWFICFRSRPGRGLSIYIEAVSVELPSLEEFFRTYLENPRSLAL